MTECDPIEDFPDVVCDPIETPNPECEPISVDCTKVLPAGTVTLHVRSAGTTILNPSANNKLLNQTFRVGRCCTGDGGPACTGSDDIIFINFAETDLTDMFDITGDIELTQSNNRPDLKQWSSSAIQVDDWMTRVNVCSYNTITPDRGPCSTCHTFTGFCRDFAGNVICDEDIACGTHKEHQVHINRSCYNISANHVEGQGCRTAHGEVNETVLYLWGMESFEYRWVLKLDRVDGSFTSTNGFVWNMSLAMVYVPTGLTMALNSATTDFCTSDEDISVNDDDVELATVATYNRTQWHANSCITANNNLSFSWNI